MRKFVCLALCLCTLSGTLRAEEPIKNIILLIGDGMGLVPASMMQIENNYTPTIFDRAENVALTKTYSADNRVTDSAAAGTALATGHKTNNTFVGVLSDGTAVESLMDVAKREGKATGVAVTIYLQHATPAAFYAHSTRRHDNALITRQLAAASLDVAIGGGMAEFVSLYGSEEEARNALSNNGFNLVRTMEELGRERGDKRVMALLSDWEVGADTGDYLAEATREAIRLLDKRDNDKAFALMVEGSLIDGMCHANDARAAQRELEGFMKAVEVAVEYAERTPGTLVVVTADHGTGGMTIVSCDTNFNLSEQGVEYRFSTTGHSAEMVPVYLYGTGVESINGIMENSELGAKLKELIARD